MLYQWHPGERAQRPTVQSSSAELNFFGTIVIGDPFFHWHGQIWPPLRYHTTSHLFEVYVECKSLVSDTTAVGKSVEAIRV